MEKLFYLILPVGRLSSNAERKYLDWILSPDGESDVDGEVEHVALGFRDLFPDNPRTVKRILVTFEVLRELKSVEGTEVPQATLMLWAIIRTRWPDAAIMLASDPEVLVRGDSAHGEIAKWLEMAEVKRVLNWPFGGPLRPRDIRECASEI